MASRGADRALRRTCVDLPRARPVALGLSLALAARFAGFLAMSLRTARVAAPVLDRIRIVSLEGYVEEVDLRPVGARTVIAVTSADGMPREKVPRRARVTTRKTPNVAAGDFVALKARLLPPSRASLLLRPVEIPPAACFRVSHRQVSMRTTVRVGHNFVSLKWDSFFLGALEECHDGLRIPDGHCFRPQSLEGRRLRHPVQGGPVRLACALRHATGGGDL